MIGWDTTESGTISMANALAVYWDQFWRYWVSQYSILQY